MISDAAVNQEAIQAFKSAMADFVYNDFIEGDEPYNLLEDASITPEARARFTAIFESRAHQCGVPIRTLRAIMKEKRGNVVDIRPVIPDSMFDWDGQPVVLRSGKYIADGRQICIQDKFGLETVCSHPIIPSKRYLNIETGVESLEISFQREHWKSIIVSKGQLASASTITQLADHGVSVTSETAREMVKYINYIDDLNRDIIPIEQMSSHLGWVNDNGFVPYVDGVEYDGQGVFLQMYKTIREHGNYKKWLDEIKAIRAAGCKPARLVMAASFASVLLSKFDALPFIFHLWSDESGTGKTVAMETAASVWAEPKVGAYCRSLKSTNVGLEQLAIFTCNLPLCLDELQTIQDKKDFDDIIYGLCEGSGKTRGARNGGLRNSPTWKNCIITTGEMPIVGSNSKAGAMNRVIEIECKGKVIPDAKNTHKLICANYGFAGRKFIEALSDGDTWQQIEAEQQKIFDRLSEVGTDKQALSASILLAADHAAEAIIFQDGLQLTEDDILPYVKSSADVDSGRRAHEYLLEWVAENRAGFIINGVYDDTRTRAVLGCIDTDKSGAAKNVWIINKSFNKALSDGGFSADSYLSWAERQGVIRTKGRDKKIAKHIPGSVTARCVCLVLDADEETAHKWDEVVHDVDLPWP